MLFLAYSMSFLLSLMPALFCCGCSLWLRLPMYVLGKVPDNNHTLLYSFFSLGSLPVCWLTKWWVASFPELDWGGNATERPSSCCQGAPGMGRVWGGRKQWGSAPLLVQCPSGSSSFWTQAGSQLCRRGSQCPKTDSSKCSQLLHTQLGQHTTLRLTHECMKPHKHDPKKRGKQLVKFLVFSWDFRHTILHMTSPSSGYEEICIFVSSLT